MNEGDILFLTQRKNKPLHRIFLSYMIAAFTRRKGQPLSEVKVHSAIIYRADKGFMVRDMDKNGAEHYTVSEYRKIYGSRMEIKSSPIRFGESRLAIFNMSCANVRVKYDYTNTFVYQVIKRLFRVFSINNTQLKRMCSEDVQRQYNMLLPGYFNTPEQTNPNELYKKVSNWTSY